MFKLYNDNCIKVMGKLPEHSFDLIATDLPYGTTQNKWDEIIPFDIMWKSFYRLLKSTGIVVLTAAQPFSSKLVMSNLKDFKYETIWEKTVGSGQLNIKKQPLRVHESILVFYRKFNTYNEQCTEGAPYIIKIKVTFKGEGYGKQTDSEKINSGFRHAKSIIKVPNPRIKGGHPTQKPLKLFEYIVKTYSNEGDLVLDCCMGSGTTGEAALKLNRNFIGIELDKNYFFKANERLSQYA